MTPRLHPYLWSSLKWAMGCAGAVSALYVLPALVRNDLNAASDVVWSLAGVVGSLIPFAAWFASARLRTTSFNESLIPIVMTAGVCFMLAGTVAPKLLYQSQAAQGVDISQFGPYGPHTFGGLLDLWALATVHPPEVIRISTDTPKQWPASFVAWMMLTPTIGAAFTVLNGISGRWGAIRFYQGVDVGGSLAFARLKMAGYGTVQLAAMMWVLDWGHEYAKLGGSSSASAAVASGGLLIGLIMAASWGLYAKAGTPPSEPEPVTVEQSAPAAEPQQARSVAVEPQVHPGSRHRVVRSVPGITRLRDRVTRVGMGSVLRRYLDEQETGILFGSYADHMELIEGDES